LLRDGAAAPHGRIEASDTGGRLGPQAIDVAVAGLPEHAVPL